MSLMLLRAARKINSPLGKVCAFAFHRTIGDMDHATEVAIKHCGLICLC